MIKCIIILQTFIINYENLINLVSEWSYYVCKFLEDFKKIKYWTRLEIG